MFGKLILCVVNKHQFQKRDKLGIPSESFIEYAGCRSQMHQKKPH